MRAVRASGNAETPAEVGEVEEPSPGPDEALVAVEAVSLNRGECRRLLSAPAGWVPGWDVAGVVARAAADGSGPAEGTRVVGLLNEGGWAERAAVPINRLGPLPDGLSAVTASTLPVAGLTALLCLRLGGSLLGKRVAVTGATGGVGVFGLQLAALQGARTTAVVSSPDRVAGLPGRGVDDVEVGLEGEEESFDLVLESVGGPLLAGALRRVRRGGAVVTFGNSSGEPTTFDVTRFYPRTGARLVAFRVFDHLTPTEPASVHLSTLAELVADGRLEIPVDVERPLDDAPEVIRALLNREIRGKAVLTLPA